MQRKSHKKPTKSGKKQLELLSKQPLAYGGELQKKRKGRKGPRTLDTKSSMHMVLRSSKAKGPWSFSRPENQRAIKEIFRRFAFKYGVQLQSVAYVGNHIHCQMRLTSRHTYRAFIRALTASVAMAVTKTSRWRDTLHGERFWDYRPFTRVVRSFRSILNLRDYIAINRLEGWGYKRERARFLIAWENARAG